MREGRRGGAKGTWRGEPSRIALVGEYPTPFCQRHPREAALRAYRLGQARALASSSPGGRSLGVSGKERGKINGFAYPKWRRW